LEEVREEMKARKAAFFCVLSLCGVMVLSMTRVALAAHPLITDDAATQGKGKAQLEFLGEYTRERVDGATTETVTGPTVPVVSYGLTDTTDLVFGVSYQFMKTSDDEGTTTVRGISDTLVDLKWRFLDHDGLSLALKPGITLPTGNNEKGLGTGKVTYHLFFIASKEIKPWAFHLNLGYIRNENTLGEREDLWHASLASVFDASERLKLVVNVGLERNPDLEQNGQVSFVLGGLIYSFSESFDLDFGVKAGFRKGVTEYSFPLGVTWRF
jgi:hypothetical protein